MRLTVDNLTYYDPTTLNLLLRGNSLVTKAKSALSISGNEIIYNPTSAEKTALGDGVVYVQLKTDSMQTEVVKITSLDLDGTIMKPFALAPMLVKKTGDTLSGDLLVSRSDASARVIVQQTKNGYEHQMNMTATTSGTIGLYDNTYSKYLIQCDKDGKISLPNALNGNITIEGTVERKYIVKHSTTSKQVELVVNTAGNAAGLYDRDGSKWIIYSDESNRVRLPSSAYISGVPHIYSTSLTKGTNPSSDVTYGLDMDESAGFDAGNRVGFFGGVVASSNGTNTARMRAMRFLANSTNYAELRVSIPTSGNPSCAFGYNLGNGAVAYTLWHTGNAPGVANAYSNVSNNGTISISDSMAFGHIVNSSKSLVLFIPYSVCGGTPTITNLKIAYASRGGNFYVRSGSNGATYTNLFSSTAVSLWTNGATARTNEVASVSIARKDRSGFQINVTFTYAICSNNTGTTATNASPVTARLTADITLE